MVNNTNTNNKRIAKNTIFLYFRMIVTMLVGLYTSRIVLAELGVEDFGIQNVVGGVVTMFGFINASMTTSTQRFLTYELGRNNVERLKLVFAGSLNIHIGIGLVIVLLAETIGLWLVNTQLVIPDNRMFAANIVYQVSVLSFFLGIVQTPYSAAIVAHEKMNIYAYFTFLDVIFKLLNAYLLVVIEADKLIVFSIILFFIANIDRLIYQIYCKRNFVEARFKMFWNREMYTSLAGFAGWNIFGSVAWMIRGQGMSVLINMFFGPVVNAAEGVARQVHSAVMGFVTNFLMAVNPQVTKYYAQGNLKEMEELVLSASRLSCLLLLVLSLPIMLNVDYILNLWLEEVPCYAAIFVNLSFVDQMVNILLGQLFITSLMATGNIRKYQVWVSLVIMLVLPVSYVALKLGGTPESIYYIMVAVTAFSGLARFYFCKIQIGYSYSNLLRGNLLPTVLTALMASIPSVLLKFYVFNNSNFVDFIACSVIVVLITILSVLVFGVKKSERSYLIVFLKNKLHKQ